MRSNDATRHHAPRYHGGYSTSNRGGIHCFLRALWLCERSNCLDYERNGRNPKRASRRFCFYCDLDRLGGDSLSRVWSLLHCKCPLKP